MTYPRRSPSDRRDRDTSRADRPSAVPQPWDAVLLAPARVPDDQQHRPWTPRPPRTGPFGTDRRWGGPVSVDQQADDVVREIAETFAKLGSELGSMGPADTLDA